MRESSPMPEKDFTKKQPLKDTQSGGVVVFPFTAGPSIQQTKYEEQGTSAVCKGF